jgi:hypothetical protein
VFEWSVMTPVLLMIGLAPVAPYEVMVNSLPSVPEEGTVRNPFHVSPFFNLIVVGAAKVLYVTMSSVFHGVAILVGSAEASLPRVKSM